MSNIKFSRKQFEKDIGKLDEKMQNRIALFGTTLESFNDEEIEIEVFPNRPDLLSYSGFKRSFLCFLGKQKGLKQYKINKPAKDYVVNIDSSVEKVRGFTACAIVKGLKFDDDKIKELIDIQEKLHFTVGRKRKKLAIGVYPLEKIKLPISYTAMEPDKIKFVPLESPGNREMSGLEILQRHPTGRDYAHLLAGKTKYPVFIDAEKNILSMPPIINSQLTGKVSENTKDIFIECSGFDFEVLKKCLNILVSALAEMGGEIYAMELKYKNKEITPDFTPEKMKISVENTNKLLGLNLNENVLSECLEKMGHNYSKGNVEVAPWRTDVLHEIDLIEDVAIAYGYDKFEPEIPKISTIGKDDRKEAIKKKISDILSGLGMLEIMNYHLTKKQDQFAKMGEKEEKDFIEVENSKTEYTILRKDLTHYLLKVFSENVDAEYPQKIFELGRVFNIGEEKSGSSSYWPIEKGKEIIKSGIKYIEKYTSTNDEEIREEEKLCLGISPGNFTESKQALEYLGKMLEIKFELKETSEFPNYFVDGRVAEIFIDDKYAGYIGEIHPKILRNWKIKMPVSVLEINLEEVFEKI